MAIGIVAVLITPLARLIRALAGLRFRVLRLATIKDIPTERFNALLVKLQSRGWRKTGEYTGFDAWIDYGKVRLRKGPSRLTLEWDNWTEGSIEGPAEAIAAIAHEEALPMSREWRWSEYD